MGERLSGCTRSQHEGPGARRHRRRRAAHREGAHCRPPPRRRPSPAAPSSRVPRNVVQARPRRTTRVSCVAGCVQSRWRSSAVIFSAMVTSPCCGTGSGSPDSPPARVSTRRSPPTATRRRRSSSSVTSSSRGTVPHRVDRPGVEARLDLHDTDTGLGVAGEDRPLDRGGTAPAGQEREVEVHHRHDVEQAGRDDPAVGHHHGELDSRRAPRPPCRASRRCRARWRPP